MFTQHKLARICFFVLTLSYCFANADEYLQLKSAFERYCNGNSDISAHLPHIRQLASECSSVVELGQVSDSTWGLLQGLSESQSSKKSYLGVDLTNPPLEKRKMLKDLAEGVGIDFIFWLVDETHIRLEPADMLYIAHVHTCDRLSYELQSFSPTTRKYICIHHTEGPYDAAKKGVWATIFDFLEKHPEWSLFEHRSNNGLAILKRGDEVPVVESTYHPDVDYFLKNKIILCTGPSLHRYDMLKNITETDMNLIPFKKIFVTTNDPKIMDITFNGKKPAQCELIPDRGWQLDCLNCIITTLKNAVNDPEVNDDDIILFKHETVFINDMDLIKKSVSTILNGYNMVTRIVLMIGGKRATDAFFVKVSAIRDVINKYSAISEFPPWSFCEAYFTDYIVNSINNVYGIPYWHSNAYFMEIGFYHYPSHYQRYHPQWDRKNRDELFKDVSLDSIR